MTLQHRPALNLRRFNHILSVVIIVLALYILLTPLLPQFGFWFSSHFRKGSVAPLVAANSGDSSGQSSSQPVPDEDTLVIPEINLQQQIYEGPKSGVLNTGAWHRPLTSTPDKGSNTVLVGHRFTYSNPNGEFYHLDKVHVGDKIVVYWNKQKYTYTVSKTFVTNADDGSIEQPTPNPMLTLYTCTPLWSAKDRLVVQADLQEQTQ